MSMATTYDLKPEEVLVALYHRAQAQGMGFLHYRPGGMTLDEARQYLARSTYVDYLLGRVMKVGLERVAVCHEVADGLYDRDNGYGAAQQALDDYYTAPMEIRETWYHKVG